MARPKKSDEERLVPFSIRLKPAGAQWIADKAEDNNMTPTDFVRAILVKAAQDYRKGWRP